VSIDDPVTATATAAPVAAPSGSVPDRAAATAEARASRPARQRLARKLLRQPLVVFSLVVLVLLIVTAVFADALAPYGETQSDFSARLTGPSADHWLGTDNLGRDTLSRLIYGSRVTLEAIVRALAVGVALGVPVGLVVGYVGGRVDQIVMRLIDVAFSIPSLVLALVVVGMLGPGLSNSMLAVGIVFATRYARLTRGVTLTEKEALYVDAARVSDTPAWSILFRHLLPNLASPLVIQTAINGGQVILIEASLSFLGLGRELERASWGGMLSTALDNQYEQPFLAVPPGVAISLTVLAFNLFGDGLRDALGRDIGRHHLSRRVSLRELTRRAARPSTVAGGAVRSEEQRHDHEVRSTPVFEVTDLEVAFPAPDGTLASVVRNVSLRLYAGQTLALVGESGSGKTITALAAIDLLPPGASVLSGRLGGTVGAHFRRGGDVAMVFQDPMTALNPVLTIGSQIAEAARLHRGLSKREAREAAIDALQRVGVPAAAQRIDSYPHEFSGGMAQRVMIAAALVAEPKVLIADEPTTALDVTVQGQIVDLLDDLQAQYGMAILFVTHDLGLVADVADQVAVMYAGEIVETGSVADVFYRPQMPYTEALLAAIPARHSGADRLRTIPGRVPAAWECPVGCAFQDRCAYVTESCRAAPVPLVEVDEGRAVRCLRSPELTLEGTR
jgi:peptide/nickel transport system permease protein